MPRQPRAWEPGDLLSIVLRGHEGRPIFATTEDRRFFVDRLARVFVPSDVDLLAWALLRNHSHLLIRITDVPPDTLFRRLNTSIAMRERRRRGDHGAVFQGRYWSGRCTGEGAAVAVLTYVLGNPCRHGVVATAAELEAYEWTAYGDVLGTSPRRLVDARSALALLHDDETTARAMLRDAMAARVAKWHAARAGIDVCEEPGCRGASDDCLLVHAPRLRRRNAAEALAVPMESPSGPAGTISRVHDEREARATRLRRAGWQLSDLVDPVCARLGADPAVVRAGGRRRAESAARAVIASVACDGVGTPVVRASEILGVSSAAISSARVRGRALLASREWTFDGVLSWSVPRG